MQVILLFLSATIAFCLSAICGGGASLLIIPLLGVMLVPAQVPAAISLGTAFSSGSRIAVFYKYIRWDVVRWFVPAALPAVLLGAILLRHLNPLYLEFVMGFFLIGNLPSLLKKSGRPFQPGGSKSLLLIIGFLAGFLSGLTGAVGLIFNRFYLRHGLHKEQIVATRAANEILLHVVKLVLYAVFGLFSSKAILIGLLVAGAALVSSWIMKAGIKKISENLFQKVGYAAMVVAGCTMLFQAGSRIVTQNRASINLYPIADGFESKLQWRGSSVALEFEYNEGFEFEREIPLTDLPIEKQSAVLKQRRESEKVIVEEVYGIRKKSFEVYYYKDKHLIRTIEL